MIQHNPEEGSKQDTFPRSIADLVESEIALAVNNAGDIYLSKVQELLCRRLGASEVKFLRRKAKFERGPDYVHGRKHFENAVNEIDAIHLVIPLRGLSGGAVVQSSPFMNESDQHAHPQEAFADEGIRGNPPSLGESKQSSTPEQQINPQVERVIQELDRQECRRDFVRAEFVAKNLIPGLGMGLDERQSQELFNAMVRDGIIMLDKMRNPKNPDHPTTSALLNREHPQVQRTLADSDEPPRGDWSERLRRNPPVKIGGGPLSNDIIRDRR